jgi:hypothetical protein
LSPAAVEHGSSAKSPAAAFEASASPVKHRTAKVTMILIRRIRLPSATTNGFLGGLVAPLSITGSAAG